MKQKTVYRCTECGYECGKWMGKCPNCDSWNTLVEEVVVPESSRRLAPAAAFSPASVRPLRDIKGDAGVRTQTNIGELNRVLGGGIVRGSVVLAGGEPGIGKSTLFLQAADSLTQAGKVLYVSGEESQEQVGLRARRLGLDSSLLFLAETHLEAILAAVESLAPDYMVLDSIQTIYSSALPAAPGSVSQVRACATALATLAKAKGVAVFIIGHVTKDGAIAGPRVLEHLVDTVLYFEGERNSSFRILRAVKNRFGSTNEIGVFEMGDQGMREVPNPSQILLSSREQPTPGAAVYCAMEGTRPVLLEVEALVSETSFGTPRRLATGVDFNRMSLIVAVLEKKIGLKLYNQDIFVNVGGGMRLLEPAMDLAVAASIVSSFRNRAIPRTTLFTGEVGLTGEMRHISQIEKRLKEAERMGMARAILPYANKKGLAATELEVVPVRHLGDALTEMFRE